MANPATSTPFDGYGRVVASPRAGISWAAVFAGTVIASALSITLLTGGMGLGFIALSPYEGDGASAGQVGIGAIVWMFIVQIIAYGVAGYVAGRLRPMWAPAYSDEIYFRDTAHGLTVWALSAVVSVFIFGSVVTAAAGAAAKGAGGALQGAAVVGLAGGAAAGAASAGDEGGETGGLPSAEYYVDQMLRGQQPDPSGDPQAARAELGRIITVSLARGELDAGDRDYAARVIAARSGMTEAEAQERVQQVMTRAEQMRQQAVDSAREIADDARQAAAAFALWAFAALLMGAFAAAYMAMVGGRAARDPD